MMKKIYIIFWIKVFVVSTLLLSSCASQTEETTATDITVSDGLELDAVLLNNAGLQFGQVEDRLLSSDVPARGELVLPPGKHAFVNSMIPGMVSKILVIPGQRVSRGQMLAYLSGPELLKLQQDYLSAHARLQYLEQEYLRQDKLKEDGVNAIKAFQQAKADYGTAVAEEAGLSSRLAQVGIKSDAILKEGPQDQIGLRSPISGKVEQVFMALGQQLMPEDPLFEIIDTRELLLQISVFEKDILSIEEGQRVSFQLGNQENKEYEAEIISVGSTVNDKARVVNVFAQFDNDAGLLPGMFASAKIHAGEEVFPSLPEDAIITRSEDEQFIYYTLDDTNGESLSFNELPVKTGYREEGWVQVSFDNPPPKGAKIVVEGAYYIWAEFQKSMEE